MFRLLTFLYSQRNTILFLVLASLSISIVVMFNDRQQHAFGDTILNVTGHVQERRQNVTDYFRLRDLCDQLSDKNIILDQEVLRLRKQIEYYQGKLQRDSSHFALVDTTFSKDTFDFIPCRAIKNSINKNYNYITLNKGENDGIEPGMGVVSPQGIAGKVIRTSKDFSLALSVLNISFKLSAMVNNSRYVGLYEWDGKNTAFGYLNNIPLDAQLMAGEQVVASGYGTTFPKGYILGTIEEAKENVQSGYYEAKIRLATNFQTLGNLYIVSALHKPSLDSLNVDLPE